MPDHSDFIARITATAASRETEHELLFDQIKELQSLGFGASRLPSSWGGGGVSLEQLFTKLIELAAADSNLAHAYRGHLAFVESLLLDGLDQDSVWVTRILAGDFVGNAQSERQETAHITTRLDREGDKIFLTGTKYYTTGSIYADWIHLAALDGDVRVGVTVSTAHDGVQSIDDWDGIGQPLTGSGTTIFDRAPVDEENVLTGADDAARWHYLGSIFQLSLIAVIAGIARAAVDDTVAYVRPRRRTAGFEGESLPREDPLVQLVVGEISGVAHAARELVLSSARALDTAFDGVRAGTADPEALRAAQLDVYRLQHVVPSLVLDALTRLFEVGGATAVSRSLALDRHWRNVRTIASHNPTAQRTKAIGQWELNGTLPEWKAPGAIKKQNYEQEAHKA